MMLLKKLMLSALLLTVAHVTFGQLVGNVEACPGGVGIYAYVDTAPCDSAYTWTINPPIGVINGTDDSPFVQVEWLSTGSAQVCVSVADSCANTVTPHCLTVEVMSIPITFLQASICDGDCVNVSGENFCAPGVYNVVLTSSLGCDSIIELTVDLLSTTFTDLGEIPIPCGGTFNVCGQTFNQTGTLQTAVCVNSLGCDSLITFTLVPDDVVAQAGPDQLLTCNNPTVTLDGSASSQGANFTYLWTGPNGFTSDILSPIVIEPGTYCLTVTNTISSCQVTDCVNVFADSAVPNVTIAGDALGCSSTGTMLVSTTSVTNPGYNWTTVDGNIVSGGNTSTPFIDEPGFYCLVVTDLISGCTAESCIDILGTPIVDLTGPSEVCPGSTATYIASLISQNSATTFYFSENGGTPTEIPVSSNAATYVTEVNESITLAVWAVDDEPCESDTTYLEITSLNYQIDFEVEYSSCNPTAIEAVVDGYPLQSFTYLWSTGEEANPIEVTSSGWYFVTLTDDSGCSADDSLFVTIDYTGSCAFIEGNVLDDVNVDCAFDVGDLPLSGWLIEAEGIGNSFFATSDAAGFYSIPVDPGDYTVTVYPLTNLWLPCENDLSASLANVDDVIVVDFFIEKLPGCPQMTVDLSSSALRRCFSNNYYFINYCNEGVEDAIGAHVELQLDEFLEVLDASVPYQDLGGDLFSFDIGDVAAGNCGSFLVQLEVSCDATLGQTHCTEAHIFPDTLCNGTNPLWTGANLVTEVECGTDSVFFTITNTGTGAMSDALEFIVIEDAVMYMEVPDGPPLGVGESFTFAVPANGSTWRLELQQEAFHPSESPLLVDFSEACGVNTMGGVSSGFVNMYSQFDIDDFVDVDCRENIGSFDPNDKQGFPRGYGEDHYILPGTDIEYLIRFQNTGTDTAFNVIIRDTLASTLDVTTVRPGASSHAYDFEVYAGGILKFTFTDIMLPDSNVNEPLSHGFVEFKISHLEGLDLGTVIENSAAIYFDFNEPIITNTTDHELAVDFPMANQVNVLLDGAELEIFPNPFDDYFRLNINGVSSGKSLNFKLLDAFGRVVGTERFASPGLDFAAGNLANGLYFFQVEMEGEMIASGKLLKN